MNVVLVDQELSLITLFSIKFFFLYNIVYFFNLKNKMKLFYYPTHVYSVRNRIIVLHLGKVYSLINYQLFISYLFVKLFCHVNISNLTK